MHDDVDRVWVEALIDRNRYLVLATTDGESPWVAPLEYVVGEGLDLWFFSPLDVRHSKHLERNPSVAVTIFDADQPEYSGETTMTLAGIQMEGSAALVDPSEFPGVVRSAIAIWDLPMPPYGAYRIRPERVFVPQVADGVNVRTEVAMD